MNVQDQHTNRNATAPLCSATRTRHHVDFFCYAPGARQVCLVGDFNEWRPGADPMRRLADGYWIARMELTHGFHQYLFLVDGKSVLDPNAGGIARNDRNERVSLIGVS